MASRRRWADLDTRALAEVMQRRRDDPGGWREGLTEAQQEAAGFLDAVDRAIDRFERSQRNGTM